MNMHNLFPVPIGMFDLDRELTDEELLFVRGQETRANEGNTTSVNNFVLRDSVMTSLRDWIEGCVSEYFKATSNPKHDVHLRITQSWFNYSEQGQWHHKHAHPNSFVSGVFYLNTNPDDKIYFYRSGWQQIKFPPEDWNIYNSESWWFEAIKGRLILFPSYLCHSVPMNTTNYERRSLAFNTLPLKQMGNKTSLCEIRYDRLK